MQKRVLKGTVFGPLASIYDTTKNGSSHLLEITVIACLVNEKQKVPQFSRNSNVFAY